MCCVNKKLHWITITNNDICHRVEKVKQESILWCKIICWLRSHINYVVAGCSKNCRLNNFHVCYYFIWIIRFPSVWAQNSVEKACLINIQKNHGWFFFMGIKQSTKSLEKSFYVSNSILWAGYKDFNNSSEKRPRCEFFHWI